MAIAVLDFSKSADVWKEIEAAEQLRNTKLAKWQPIIDQMTGVSASDQPGQSAYPDNHPYEYVSYIAPSIVIENPRATVRSNRQPAESVVRELEHLLEQAVEIGLLDEREADAQYQRATLNEQVALAMEHGVNRWIHEADYSTLLDRVCVDMLIGFGVLVSSLEPAVDDPKKRWPKSKRISPKRFLMDSTALHETEARWKGHWSVTDKDDLLKRARENKGEKWKIDEIQALSPDGAGQYRRSGRSDDLERQEVMIYELWVPDYTETGWPGPANGFHGGLFTLGGVRSTSSETAHEFIREPRPFYGPPWGPYSLFGAYIEPDSPYPVSPLVASYAQISELNAHVRSMSISAAKYKRLVIVADQELQRKLTADPDNFVILTDDENFSSDKVVVVELGGITSQQLEHYGLFRERLDRVSGLSDPQRGVTTPGVTATADAIAEASNTLRVAYIKKKFATGVRQDLRSKAWYLYHEERVEFALGAEASEALGMIEPIFHGGATPDTSFADLELEIEAFSMERTNEVLIQLRTKEAADLIIAISQLLTVPGVKWRKLVQKIGDSLNMPDLVDVLDEGMIEQLAQMGQQMGVPGAQVMSGEQAVNGQQRSATSKARMIGSQQGSTRAT